MSFEPTLPGRNRSASTTLGLIALLLAAALGPGAQAHAPHDVVLELGISPTFPQDQTLFAAFTLTDHHLFGRSTDGGRSWQEYSLPMMQVSISQFAFSPNFAEDGIAFTATYGLGIYRTQDHGITWEAVNDGMPSLLVRGLAVSPGFADNGLLIAATSNGCARSTDGGQTWSESNSGTVNVILTAVSFAPGMPDTVFIGGKTMHRSDDGGLNWIPRAEMPKTIEMIACSPNFAADQTLMVCFGLGNNGARFSVNGGSSFTNCVHGLTDLAVMELAIAADGTTFAATKSAGCYRSATPGGNWALMVNGFESPSDLTTVHNTEAVVSPAFATDDTVFIGAYEGLYISHNRGASWRQSDVYNQKLNRHIVFSPDYANDRSVYLGNYGGGVMQFTQSPAVPLPGGLGASTQPGGLAAPSAAGAPSSPHISGAPAPKVPAAGTLTWMGGSNGIASLYSDALDISPAFASDRTLFYGYTSLHRTTNGADLWTNLPKPAGVTVVRRLAVSPDYANDRTVFIGSGGAGLWRSSDSGDSWIEMLDGVPHSIATRAINFSPDYANDRTVFVATGNAGVYRSTNGGDRWTSVSAGLENEPLRCMAISPDFPKDRTVFVGSIINGLFRSQDAGESWVPVNTGLPTNGLQIIEAIVLSPDFATDRTAFTVTLNDGIFKSLDGGESWQPSGNGMPLDAVRTLAISPAFTHDGTLLAGTYGWTWQSRDAGASWSRLPGGLRVDETHPTVFLSANWSRVKSTPNNGAGVDQSAAAGAWEEFEFYGDSVSWFANTDPSSGIAQVQIDSGAPALVDLYSSQLVIEARVFHHNFPEVGWHSIRVTNTGTKNEASSFTNVRSDGFFYTF